MIREINLELVRCYLLQSIFIFSQTNIEFFLLVNALCSVLILSWSDRMRSRKLIVPAWFTWPFGTFSWILSSNFLACGFNLTSKAGSLSCLGETLTPGSSLRVDLHILR